MRFGITRTAVDLLQLHLLLYCMVLLTWLPLECSLGRGRILQQKPVVEVHKPLIPLNNFDVGVFVVAAVVLFIAAGAGMVSTGSLPEATLPHVCFDSMI